jgi:tyrosine-protein kinase Etk/Wzc
MNAMEAVPIRPLHDPGRPGDTLDLQGLMRSVWRERLRVLGAALIAGLLTLGVAFTLPRWYRASAVILPPEETDLLSNMSMAQRALSKFPSFGVLPDIYTPADQFKAILLSRTVQEDVAHEFNLASVYKLKSQEKTLKEFHNHYKVKLNPDGTILVQVEDRSPQRSADMANALLVALDRYNMERRNTQAHRTRAFLQRRVAETDSALRVSEIALRTYQESHQTVTPTSMQGGGDTQAAADLMARKITLEVRLGVLRGYLQEDNDQVVQVRDELEQLKIRIAALPALQNELLRRLRDQKIQEQLYLLLTAELEQARIREAMDTPTVQVLDPAIPPERHIRPKRLLLALASALLGAGAAIAWIAVRDGVATARVE